MLGTGNRPTPKAASCFSASSRHQVAMIACELSLLCAATDHLAEGTTRREWAITRVAAYKNMQRILMPSAISST
jgi:hypothetical protein